MAKAKKKAKKTKKTRSKSKSSDKKPKLVNEIVITAIIVVVAISLAFLFYTASKTRTSLVAEVNGVGITPQDLNEISLTVPPQMRGNISQEELVEQAINFEIIRQEAEKMGITVTEEEVEENIESSLAMAGVNREILKDSLEQQKISWESMFNAYRKQMLSYKFLNQTILNNITVKDAEIRAVYEAYGDSLGGVSYEEIKDDIRQTVLIMKSQEELNDFLERKRQEYDILRFETDGQS